MFVVDGTNKSITPSQSRSLAFSEDHEPASSYAYSQHLLDELQNHVISDDFRFSIERFQSLSAEPSRHNFPCGSDDVECDFGTQAETLTCHSNSDDVPMKQLSSGYIDSDFEVIGTRDIIEAMAEFIAQSVSKMNETKYMPSRTIQCLITSIFGDIRSKGLLAKLWGWGSFLYTAYGWSSYTLSVYRHPALLKLILQTISSAVRWALGRQ